jgi:hypothetical protein
MTGYLEYRLLAESGIDFSLLSLLGARWPGSALAHVAYWPATVKCFAHCRPTRRRAAALEGVATSRFKLIQPLPNSSETT